MPELSLQNFSCYELRPIYLPACAGLHGIYFTDSRGFE